MRSFLIVLASATLVASMQSCATLPTLGICGNGLVDEAEDCDGQTGLAAGVHCASANQQNACRYTCDVKDNTKLCPPKYFCSPTDGVCRATSGSFTERASVPFNADHVGVADFDGDGISDIFVSKGVAEAVQTKVYFFGSGGAVSGQTSMPPVSFGAGAVLTGKTTAADLVGFLPNQAGATGMLVMKGDATRSMLPASFSSFPLGRSDVKFLPFYLPSYGMLGLKGREIVAFDIATGTPARLHRLAKKPHLEWGRSGYLGDVTKGGPRLALANAHSVDVYEYKNFQGSLAVTVSLPDSSAIVQDFWFTSYDSDPFLDLVVVTCTTVSSCFDERVFVAYGTADGSLLAPSRGGAGSSFVTAADVMFSQPIPPGGHAGTILAVQNLSGGPSGDVITQNEIVTESSGSWSNSISFSNPASEVVTADFNHDGAVDLMVAIDNEPELEFLLNAGGELYNSALIPLSGSAHHMVVGDFDGDLYPDVAFAEQIDSGSAKVGFAFGGPGALPTGPIEAGPFLPISQVLANANILNPGVQSSRTDLLTVTGTGLKTSVAIFPGSANRQMYSPWFFVPHGAFNPYQPSSAAIGAFTSGSRELATLIIGGATAELCLLNVATNSSLTEPDLPLPTATENDSYSSVLVTLPGQNGAADDVAVVAHTNGIPKTRGSFAVAHAQGGKTFAFSHAFQQFDPPPLMFDNTQPFLTMADQPGGAFGGANSFPRVPACAADLDGDGATDLALIGDEQPRSLRIAWGESGSLAVPKKIVLGKGLAPDWIACIVTSLGTEIAVLQGPDVYLVQCDRGRGCTGGAKVASPGGGVYIPRAGIGSIGGASGNTEPASLAVGDVTGDGLDDLVVTGFNHGVQIYSAKPTIR